MIRDAGHAEPDLSRATTPQRVEPVCPINTAAPLMDNDKAVELAKLGSSPGGYHGMKACNQKRYRPEDWAIWGKLGDNARLVDVVPNSPAWLGDMRSGVWVLSINEMPFEVFEKSFTAVGAVADVEAFCPKLGTFRRRLVLTEPPAKTSTAIRQKKRRRPKWADERPVLPGKQVFKDSRPRYLEFAANHPFVRRHVWLLTSLLRMQWHRGIIPRHITVANAAGCSISAVKRSQACCQHFGFLRVISGKRAHRHNTYEVCWPADSHLQLDKFKTSKHKSVQPRPDSRNLP